MREEGHTDTRVCPVRRDYSWGQELIRGLGHTGRDKEQQERGGGGVETGGGRIHVVVELVVTA